MTDPIKNKPKPLDRPEYTDEELRAARAYINHQRKQFALNIGYAEQLTYTTVANFRADGPEDETE